MVLLRLQNENWHRVDQTGVDEVPALRRGLLELVLCRSRREVTSVASDGWTETAIQSKSGTETTVKPAGRLQPAAGWRQPTAEQPQQQRRTGGPAAADQPRGSGRRIDVHTQRTEHARARCDDARIVHPRGFAEFVE